MNSHHAKIKRADELYSAIKSKKIWCERCGEPGDDPHHIIYRDNMNLRWNLDNSLWLCRSCHRWAHDHRREFEDWFKLYHPIQWAFLEREKHKINPNVGLTITATISYLEEKNKEYA